MLLIKISFLLLQLHFAARSRFLLRFIHSNIWISNIACGKALQISVLISLLFLNVTHVASILHLIKICKFTFFIPYSLKGNLCFLDLALYRVHYCSWNESSVGETTRFAYMKTWVFNPPVSYSSLSTAKWKPWTTSWM